MQRPFAAVKCTAIISINKIRGKHFSIRNTLRQERHEGESPLWRVRTARAVQDAPSPHPFPPMRTRAPEQPVFRVSIQVVGWLHLYGNGSNMPLLTELGGLWRFAYYKHGAPNGAIFSMRIPSKIAKHPFSALFRVFCRQNFDSGKKTVLNHPFDVQRSTLATQRFPASLHPLLNGIPSALGAREWPTNPARTSTVTT